MQFSIRTRASIFASLAFACAGSILHAAVVQIEYGPQDSQDAEFVLVAASSSYLGINIRDIDVQAAKLLGLKSTSGVEVTAVDHDAPAGKSGIHLRDVILTVDGKEVNSAKQFREVMHTFPVGREVHLNVVRNGKPLKFTIRLVDRATLQHQAVLHPFSVPLPTLSRSFSNAVATQSYFDSPDGEEPGGNLPEPLARSFRIGALLDPIGPQLAAYFGVKDGSGLLVKSVEPGGAAATAGLEAGDVVLKLNDADVMTELDWLRSMQSALSASDRPIQLTIVRNKRIQTLTIQQPKPAATEGRVEWPVFSFQLY